MHHGFELYWKDQAGFVEYWEYLKVGLLEAKEVCEDKYYGLGHPHLHSGYSQLHLVILYDFVSQFWKKYIWIFFQYCNTTAYAELHMYSEAIELEIKTFGPVEKEATAGLEENSLYIKK